ncbi:MAG TPA: aquaporin [Actinomycetota bacterium]|nr:aquaporin [Actinomycetota bacterium]
MAVAGRDLHDHRHDELDDHHVAGEASLGRRLAAEFVGTTLFVAVGTGAATVLALGPLQRIADLADILQQAPGQDRVFGALLGNTLGDVLPVALAFAFALTVLVYAFGGVSGAHFNPAVTFALAISRRFRWGDLPLYWIAQIAGGILGAFIVAGIYGQDGATFGGTDILFGATVVHVEWQKALLAEAAIAFVLMTAIMAVAIDHRAPKGWSGLIIGLALAAGILLTATATDGSANFARTLGPFLASLAFGASDLPWNDLAIYAAGPIIGAAAAAIVYETVTGLESAAPAPEPGAATHDELLHSHPGAAGTVTTQVGPSAGDQGSSVPPGLAPTGDDPTPPSGGPKI